MKRTYSTREVLAAVTLFDWVKQTRSLTKEQMADFKTWSKDRRTVALRDDYTAEIEEGNNA